MNSTLHSASKSGLLTLLCDGHLMHSSTQGNMLTKVFTDALVFVLQLLVCLQGEHFLATELRCVPG